MPQAHPLADAVDTNIYPTLPLGMEVVNQGKVVGVDACIDPRADAKHPPLQKGVAKDGKRL